MSILFLDNSGVPISGLLIDTLSYYCMRDSQYKDKSLLYYDFINREFFDFLRTRDEKQTYYIGSHPEPISTCGTWGIFNTRLLAVTT
jgi:hypothetical protein